MWMQLLIYSIKATSQAGNIWVKDIVKIYAFRWKIQQKALGPEESTAGVAYLSMRIHPKVTATFYLMVQGRAQLEHSSHAVKVGVDATC